MRVVFVGAPRLVHHTTRLLLSLDHDVVIIEQDKEAAEQLSESLGCGVIHGDGSTPAILGEADPHASDYLFCVTENDQTNIIASLVGRSLGYRHVVTHIDDPAFEHICVELGLENTIVPSQAISRYLASIVEGETSLSISAMIKNDAALFSFVIGPHEADTVKELKLPQDCRMLLLYRGPKFILAEDTTELKQGDEVVIVCHQDRLNQLRNRWIHTDLGTDELA